MKRCLLVLLVVGCKANDVDVMSTTDAFMPDTLPLCMGTCQTTALTATFMATRTLDVAYFGVNQDLSLHIEAYKGAADGCPMMNSPTPEYTLILGKVSSQQMSPGSFIDFKGDMLPSVMPVTATNVMITPVAASDMFVALDVNLTFDAGTVAGHLYATHCASLDN